MNLDKDVGHFKCRLGKVYIVNNNNTDTNTSKIIKSKHCYISMKIQWRYSPTGPWPTERPPQVSEASANFYG